MDEDIKKLLEDNRQAIEETKQLAQKTATYVKWLRIMDFVKLLLIVIPIIAAWIYLPQFLEAFTSEYTNLIPGLTK